MLDYSKEFYTGYVDRCAEVSHQFLQSVYIKSSHPKLTGDIGVPLIAVLKIVGLLWILMAILIAHLIVTALHNNDRRNTWRHYIPGWCRRRWWWDCIP